MTEQNQQRYYASEHYYLPADETEAARLNLQHSVVIEAFDNRLSLASLELKSGDRVLESAAGTGVWALEFFEENKIKGIVLDIECFDISDKQFPKTHPTNMHFSLHSATDLPAEWASTFAYVHQRLLVGAMNDTRWHKVISELHRVLIPGGWVELVEVDADEGHYDVGPASTKLKFIQTNLHRERGVIRNPNIYLPPLLKEIGFVDVQCEVRHSPIGKSPERGFPADKWAEYWRGLKPTIINADGYGFVKSGDEYEELVSEAVIEWKNSDKAFHGYCTVLGRKP
ncbi:hypothetical protein GYMLUDRAFT_42872 [Collybiopsis luxurians FD-317 M1]|uniref:Methyltransferase domain-containing protein n=1 Tax=Collybiopsis luxurians FD-317 M1 TaxID=944289 RepID=A0A0D0BZG0_9AGAR|nr:hypothetical protein GYMLUDRAFT_42872 [Collybiopsis luxurians FD-317 M1]